MTRIVICACGTNHDAIDAAIRLASTIKFDEKVDCAIWQLAVAHAFHDIMVQVFGNAVTDSAVDKGVDDRHVHKYVNDEVTRINRCIVVGFLHNPEAHAKMIDLMRRTFNMDVKRPEHITNGPGPKSLEKAGFDPIDALILMAGELPDDDTQESTKPN